MRALVALLLILAHPSMHAQTVIETVLPSSGRPLSVALPGAQPDPGAPIVVSLHYGGPVSPYYGRGLLEGVVAPALGELGAVMVAPDCPARAWTDADCSADVFEAIRVASDEYRADPQRVLLVGYSKGGIGAWALSDAHPDRFAAIVVMAGRASDPSPGAATPTPAIVLHGERDELFPLDAVRSAVSARTANGQDLSLTVLPGVSHYETGAFTAPLREQLPRLRALLLR